MLTVYANKRPYTLTFKGTQTSYPLSADECQRLLDSYPILQATRYRVVLQGEDQKTVITAATLGGGPAFEISR